jgi:hypothetical protein
MCPPLQQRDDSDSKHNNSPLFHDSDGMDFDHDTIHEVFEASVDDDAIHEMFESSVDDVDDEEEVEKASSSDDSSQSDGSSDDDTDIEDHDDEEAVNKEFDDLQSQPLYADCPLSVFFIISMLARLRVLFKVPLKSLKFVFSLVEAVLPKGHNLPSFSRCMTLLRKKAVLRVTKIPICVNDCVLFTDFKYIQNYRNALLHSCPVCGQARDDAAGKPRKVNIRNYS